MAEDYRGSSIWRECLEGGKGATDKLARTRLRQAFETLRQNAAHLAGEISHDLRQFTVHDITHSDALWELAGLIAGPALVLNPLEAFVLGCSFVVHDLGMALASYDEGLAGLREHPEWLGISKALLKQRLRRAPTREELAALPPEIAAEATSWLLRALHGKRAASLLNIHWKALDGTQLYLLEDAELRASLGHLIGQIAQSHSWPSETLNRTFTNSLGVPAFLPSTWVSVDALKIALLLRVADAANIDSRRAPSFLAAVTRPSGIAKQHWNFQNKVLRPHIKSDRLQFSSSPFSPSEAGDWWLCFDVLQMIDTELRSADNINRDSGRICFAAKGVFGIDSPEQIALTIPPIGWFPIDAKLKVSDVASLVRTLGGEGLYGRNGIVPLRELIQNATDAVSARRALDNKEANWGSIDVSVGTDQDGAWIEVRDSGVGMSRKTLTGPFLDFGSSFWSSPEAMIEFPTLSASDFDSIGKFGIGFFSVFMWGDRVKVTTRRFDASLGETLVLTFENGLSARPILRVAEGKEQLREPGTAIKVWPRAVTDTSGPWIRSDVSEYGGLTSRTPLNSLKWLCPAARVNISFTPAHSTIRIAKANSWLKAKPYDLLRSCFIGTLSVRKDLLTYGAKTLTPVKDNGVTIGRACIAPYLDSGCITVGGLRASYSKGIAGLFVGNTYRASRDKATIAVTRKCLDSWVRQQSKAIKEHLPPELQAQCAVVLSALGGPIEELYIARVAGKWLSFKQLVTWARKRTDIVMVDSADESKMLDNFEASELDKDLLVEPFTYADLSYISQEGTEVNSGLGLMTYKPALIAIATAWKISLESLGYIRGDVNIGSTRTIMVDGVSVKRR